MSNEKSILNKFLVKSVHTAKNTLNGALFFGSGFLLLDAVSDGLGVGIGRIVEVCYKTVEDKVGENAVFAFINKGNWHDLVDHKAKIDKLEDWYNASSRWAYGTSNAQDIIGQAGATGIIGAVELLLGTNTHFGLAKPISIVTGQNIELVIGGIAAIDGLLYIAENYLNQQDTPVDTDYN